jgi:hypothetical protein
MREQQGSLGEGREVAIVKFRMKNGETIIVRIQYRDARDIESKLGDPRRIFEITSQGEHHSIKAQDVVSMTIEAPGTTTNIATGNARVGMQIGY